MNLKDEFNIDFVSSLSEQFKALSQNFDVSSFVRTIMEDQWEQKELKERMRCITENIHHHLPFPYDQQIEILSQVAVNYGGLKGMVFPDFIQIYGLENFETSMNTMELFTELSTAEFAIRPFIEKYPKETMTRLITWSTASNHHLRRLSSEGTRPRLPWASPLRGFIKDPNPVLPILTQLKNDDSLYVRKSVANHLNDISKDHPKLVLGLAQKWHGKTANTNWIIKQALRTLLKKGNKSALAIFGFNDSNNIEISGLKISHSTITIGEFVYFEFEVQNNSTTERNVRLEYRIDYVKANGKASGKVFQLSEFRLKSNAKKAFKRKQWFKQLSTRKHYPGKHQIMFTINGDEKSGIDLLLSD